VRGLGRGHELLNARESSERKAASFHRVIPIAHRADPAGIDPQFELRICLEWPWRENVVIIDQQRVATTPAIVEGDAHREGVRSQVRVYQRIVACTSAQVVLPTRCVQNIVTVIPAQPIIARAAIDVVVSGTALQPVVPCLAVKLICPLVAEQGIDTSAAKKLVVAKTSIQPIITAVAIQAVIAGQSTESIVTRSSPDRISQRCPIENVAQSSTVDDDNLISDKQSIWVLDNLY
jgi:hypothetical protein